MGVGMVTTDTDQLTPIIARTLRIDDITRGDSGKSYLLRYRGRLYSQDTAGAYDQLASALRPFELTPLFRRENEQHVILLVPGITRLSKPRVWINIALFAATVISVLIAGTIYSLGGSYDGPANPGLADLAPAVISSLGGGLAFTVSLLAILLAHEFGHYLAGRYHKAAVTLPYFIPFPLSAFGTMGAFIQLKEPPKNKRVLLDIGVAGPLAGLVVAIPVLILGLSLSQVSYIPVNLPPGQGLQIEGNSLLYLFSKYLVFGQLLPSPGDFSGINPFIYWVRYFFTGQPVPLGGIDVMLSPIAWAGWAGLLVTALNLIPAGQLDGGHLIYVLLGKRANVLLPVILIVLVFLGFFWPGWWFWAFLILLLGRLHAEPLDQITVLDAPRQAVAILGIIIFLLVFTPVPLLMVG
jgi:membrane-associated protease RseP (regulator of RpoE activity)